MVLPVLVILGWRFSPAYEPGGDHRFKLQAVDGDIPYTSTVRNHGQDTWSERDSMYAAARKWAKGAGYDIRPGPRKGH